MIHSIVDFIFSYLCHQEADRCWAIGGNILPFCQRCTGVYVGAGLMLFLLPLMKFKSNWKILLLHILFLVQMIIFGYHLIPHNATIRTLSGQLFIIGALYFIWYNIQNRWNLIQSDSKPYSYFGGIIATLLFLQLLIHTPFLFSFVLVEILSLVGILTILSSALTTLILFFYHPKFSSAKNSQRQL